MITPDKFAAASVYELLKAGAAGHAGLDRRWLRAILDYGENAIDDLVRFGAEDQTDYPVPLDQEMLMILQQLRSPRAVNFFVEYLRRNPNDTPDFLVDAMYPIREALLEPLIELCGDLDEYETADVAFALAAFRIRDERVLQILLERLEYDAGDGALCLGLYGDPASRPALEDMLGKVDDEHLQQDIQDAIGQLGREADETPVPFDIWEQFPETAMPDTALLEEADLLEMLNFEDPEYRAAAAEGISNRELSPAAVHKLLARAKEDQSEKVRGRCWEALASEVADNDAVFDAMLSRLGDSTVPLVERKGALTGLGQRSNEAPIRVWAEEFYANPETRAAALGAMWNSLDKSFASYFPHHLDDPDPEVRKHAISGVGYLGIEKSAEKLRDFFDLEEYRPNALFAYALAVRNEVSPGRMRPLLRKIEDLAGGFTEDESELVELALDERLILHGHKPIFNPEDGEETAETESTPVLAGAKTGRNDPCPCGSGKKFKKCHGA